MTTLNFVTVPIQAQSTSLRGADLRFQHQFSAQVITQTEGHSFMKSPFRVCHFISGPEIWYHFRSDESGSGGGFLATFKSSEPPPPPAICDPDIMAASGNVGSPNWGEGEYPESVDNCVSIITLPSASQRVQLTFRNFEV